MKHIYLKQLALTLVFFVALLHPQPSLAAFSNPDTIPPVAVASIDSVFLDSIGNAILSPSTFGQNSSDNRGIEHYNFLDSVYNQLGQRIYGSATNDYSSTHDLSEDGRVLAIASQNHGNFGQVRVYHYDGSSWQLRATLFGLTSIETYAHLVKLSNDGRTLAVSSPGYNGTNKNGCGRVTVYEFNDTTYVQRGSAIEGAAAGDGAGAGLALSADGLIVAVGSPRNDNTNGNNAGHVRVYRWNGLGWSKLGADIDGEAADDRSGDDLSLCEDGSILAIGADWNDGNGTDAGHVRVYRWNGSSWNQMGSDLDGEAAGDEFGSRVSLSSDGQRLAVGAPFNDGNGVDAGHVRVYRWTGFFWLKLGNDIDGEAADDRAFRVAISGDGSTVAIGAASNGGNGLSSGHVRVFQISGLSWVQVGNDIDGDAANDQTGGCELSYDGTILTVGAFAAASPSNSFAGLVRVFNRQINQLNFSCADVGLQSATLWVADSAGNSDQTTASFRLLDTIAPTIIVQPAFVYPAGSSTVTIALSDVLLSSFDNCNISSITFSDSIFSLAQMGANNVIITATDANGNTTIDSTTVWVSETERPQASSRDTSLYLDQSGEARLPATSLENGSTDNTGISEHKILDTLFSQLGSSIPGHSIYDLAGFVDVSANGKVMAIGGPSFTGNRLLAGHVRVYEWQDTAWIIRGNFLEMEGEAAQDQSGTALSLSANGNILAVGAYRNDGNGTDAGHVRIYSWDGYHWTQRGGDLDGASAGENFGYSLDLSDDGNRLAVGARHTNSSDGQVRIFQWSGNQYVQQGVISGFSSSGERFGSDLDLSSDGNYIAVGAPYNDLIGTNAGAVRIYNITSLPASIMGSVFGSLADDKFGTTVAISGDGQRIAAGAPGNDSAGVNAGHVRVLRRSGNAWLPLGSTLFGKKAGDQFGQGLSLSDDGDILAVGASDLAVSANDSGYSQVFALNSSDWQEWGPVIAGGDAGDNAYQVSLSADGSRLALGSWTADAFGNNSGEVRVYQPRRLDTLIYGCNNLNTSFSALWVSDAFENGDVAIADLSIFDTIKPQAVARNLTIRIGLPGFKDITVEDIDSASTDNCSIAFRSISDSSFTTQDSGVVPVILTVMDGSGNTAYDTAWVTVIPPDTIPPTAVTTPQNLYLDSLGMAYLQASTFGANSTDNYGVTLRKFVQINQIGQDIIGEAAQDFSGEAIGFSSDGSTVAISAYKNDGGAIDAGHVRVFEWDGSSWTQKGTDFDGSVIGSRFGESVALSADGNILAIGNPYNGSLPQAVYVYEWIGNNWVPRGQTITGANFWGGSVSLSDDGNSLLIGAQSALGPGIFTGEVEIYSWVDSLWVPKGQSAFGETGNNYFGSAAQISADGSTYIAGAYGNTANRGSARVLAWNPDSAAWIQRGADLDGVNANDLYGQAVSINADGNVVAVSSKFHNANGIQAGQVQVFRWDGSNWIQVGSDLLGVTGDQFGSAIRLNAAGNVIVVGSLNSNFLRGKAQVFGWLNNQWTQLGADLLGNPSDQFGKSVSISADGSRIVVGAIWADGNVPFSNPGEVSIYTLLNDSVQYSCADIGPNAETLWVQDAAGNSAIAIDTVSVSDTLAPQIHTKDLVVYLDTNYLASISTNDIDSGSTDNCQLDSLYLDINNFNCNHLGANTVMLTGLDAYGNTSYGTATVTVVDTIFPIARTRSANLYLDAFGNAVLGVGLVDSFSTDACLIDSLHLSKTYFSCAELGVNPVWLYVTDGSGNVDSALSSVTVLDSVAPRLVGLPNDTILGSCNAFFGYPTPLFADNCSVDSIWQINGLARGNIFPTGSTVNTFVAMDASGNSDTASFTVSIIPHNPPNLPSLPSLCENDLPFDLSMGDTTLQFSGSSVNLNWFSPNQAGSGVHTVTYTYTDSLGCQTKDSVQITVNSAPTKPTVNSASGGQLTTQNYSRYQWYLNGNLLTGDTLQSVIVSQTGNYQVRVWNAAGCSSLSDSTGAGIGLSELVLNSIRLYPNPSPGMLNVDMKYASGNYDLQLIDSRGTRVFSTTLPGGKQSTLDLSNLPAGVYNILLTADNGENHARMIVLKP